MKRYVASKYIRVTACKEIFFERDGKEYELYCFRSGFTARCGFHCPMLKLEDLNKSYVLCGCEFVIETENYKTEE